MLTYITLTHTPIIENIPLSKTEVRFSLLKKEWLHKSFNTFTSLGIF